MGNFLYGCFIFFTYLVDKRGVNMDAPIIEKIVDLLIDLCKDAFSGLKGKILLFNIRRRLRRQIFNEILSKYGDTVFYNDLDHFLTKNAILYEIAVIHQYFTINPNLSRWITTSNYLLSNTQTTAAIIMRFERFCKDISKSFILL